MAGAGAKLFVSGDVLTAAQVNTYLQDQVIMRFATTTDRDNAFGGVGEPTLAEGMFAYIDADNNIYYYTGSAWEVFSQPLENTVLGYRNVIINGAMQVAQRGTSTASITTSGYRTADRWNMFVSSLGTWTQSVENDAPTGSGFRKSVKVLCTTADASPAASDNLGFQQRLEGQNLQQFLKGTASAKQFALTFWVKSNVTGTFIAELVDNDNTRSISASYTISASATWEKKTIIFPADTTGAFDNDSEASLYATFWLAAGSNFTSGTLATTWASTTNANRAVGQTNLAAATNNYWQITGVQLEAGSVATPFEFEDYGTTLAKCLRYYWKNGKVLVADNYATAGGNVGNKIFMPVVMRTTPTLTQTGAASFSLNTSATTFLVDTNGSNEQQQNLYFVVGATTGETYLYRSVEFGAEL